MTLLEITLSGTGCRDMYVAVTTARRVLRLRVQERPRDMGG